MVGVRKLWKSLRSSVAAIKQKLGKKKKRVSERSHHYNFSDDDEIDGRLGKKMRAWKIKAVSCVVGRSEIESQKNQFVYVTDLYCPAPSALMADDDKTKAEEKDGASEDKGGASGSADTHTELQDRDVNRNSRSSDDRTLKLKAEASDPSARKKIVSWAESEEVDSDAEQFISKFYEDIRLQRQKSISEYREMLERGTTSG